MIATRASAVPHTPQNDPERTEPRLLYRVRTVLTVLALAVMADANGLFTRQDETYWSVKKLNTAFQSNPLLALITSAMWLLIAALMFGRVRLALRRLLRHRSILMWAVLAPVSALWSQVPDLSARRGLFLAMAFVFAWFIVDFYTPREQARILVAVGILVGVASLLMALALPEYGIASGGEWKGVFGQKNRLGLSIFYLFSSLPFRAYATNRKILRVALEAVLPLGLILMSQSKTSLILTAVLIGVRVLGPHIARRRRDQLPFLIFTGVIGLPLLAIAASAAQAFLLGLIGRDPTLTGRTEHWSLLLTFVARHPLLGYGYEGFWIGAGDSLDVVRSLHAVMTGSDSAFVDTMLEFGLLGLVLLIAVFAGAVRDIIKLGRMASPPLLGYWYAGVILATIVGSVTEILFLPYDGIVSFIFVLCCAGLRKITSEEPASAAMPAQVHVAAQQVRAIAGV